MLHVLARSNVCILASLTARRVNTGTNALSPRSFISQTDSGQVSELLQSSGIRETRMQLEMLRVSMDGTVWNSSAMPSDKGRDGLNCSSGHSLGEAVTRRFGHGIPCMDVWEGFFPYSWILADCDNA